jgi:hypothetical protein
MEENKIETEVLDEHDETVATPIKYAINSYGADYPVDGLVKRIKNGSIYIPDFQRNYVWSQAQASKFIESLLLGLPVPGIFLAKEDDNKLIVIDGQQRLRSLQMFYDRLFRGKEFQLKSVQQQFEGKTFDTLDAEDRRRLDDSILHATIVKQEEPSEDDSSIYLLFERLNTGGLQLQPQEIRFAIFTGELNDLLVRLNEYPRWREIYGPLSKRRKDEELILRFLALKFDETNYIKPLRYFLNRFASKNRQAAEITLAKYEVSFKLVVDFIARTLGKRAFRPLRSINASVYDSVMVATSEGLETGIIKNDQNYVAAYERLLTNAEYKEATEQGTSDEPVVKRRIRIAKDILLN